MDSHIKHTSVNRRYVIRQKLGQGGMGSVYLAEDTLQGNQLVALKTIPPHAHTAEIREHFKCEFEVMSKLKHPLLARVYDFGIDQHFVSDRTTGVEDSIHPIYYITMEYLAGVSLREYLQQQRLSIQQILRLMVLLCRAIEFIHSRGILHRDIKPANIMVCREPEGQDQTIKLMDFGLSDFHSAERLKLKGTLNFLAPELIQLQHGEETHLSKMESDISTFDDPSGIIYGELDYRVDIYAAGITFYSLLTRRTFFDPDTPKYIVSVLQDPDLFQKRTEKALQEIGDTRLQTIISKMIAYDPRERYDYISQVITDINEHFDTTFLLETPNTSSAYLLGANFVGREQELSILQQLIEKKTKQLQAILVRGGIGVGKSRLLKEFKRQCQLAELIYVEGICYSGPVKSYEPFLDILSELLMYIDDRLLSTYGPILKKILPSHGRLLEIDEIPVQDPKSERYLIVDGICRLIYAFSHESSQLLLLAVHDVHWADEASLEVLDKLLQLSETEHQDNLNFAIVACAREEDMAKLAPQINRWRQENWLQEIVLSPFATKDVQLYINAIFGERYVHSSLAQAIPLLQMKVGGNPFFLQELMRTLVERQIIQRQSMQWSLSQDLHNIDTPGNLKSIIQKRLLKLNFAEHEQQALFVLVLLNKPVSINSFRQLVPPPDDDPSNDGTAWIPDFLQRLETREIVGREKIEGKIYFRLEHEMIRSTVEEQIPHPANVHRLIASRLELLIANVSNFTEEAYVEELAYHFSQGKVALKAMFYLGRAGDKARLNYANHEALTYYQDALTIAVQENLAEVQIDLLLKQGAVCSFIGEWAQGISLFQQAHRIAEQAGDTRRLGQACWGVGELYYNKNDYEQSRTYLTAALAHFETIGDVPGKTRAIRHLGCIHWRYDELEKAMACADQCLELHSKLSDPREKAYTLKLKADVYSHLNRFPEAMQHYQLFLSVCQELQDRNGISLALNNMGVVYVTMGDYQAALECYEKALTLKRQLGNKQWESISLCNISDVYYLLGQYEQALQFIDRAIANGRILGIPHHLCSYLIDKARTLFALGKYQQATQLNDEGLQLAQMVRRREYVFKGRLLRSRLKLAAGINLPIEDKNEIVAELRQLVADTNTKEEVAEIYYDLWKITNNPEDGLKAYTLYKKLYETVPKERFREKIQEFLTGAVFSQLHHNPDKESQTSL